MLIIEQLATPNAHSHTHNHVEHDLPLHSVKKDAVQSSSKVEFEAELGDIEQEEGLDRSGYRQSLPPPPPAPSTEAPDPSNRAFPLTFGLVVHGLADGLALGASSLSKDQSGISSSLSIIGGTFLYVATVLQPVSDHRGAPASGELRPISRVFHITFGMFIPFLLSFLLGHGH
ncbi:hypothetical protein H0H87_006808 [Tephrocybe sp. NHM501043]|nr:hypothetical protein H0H87_006808 [Tephrocybe sp. NHM501043]